MRPVVPVIAVVCLALLPLGCGSSGTADVSGPAVTVLTPSGYLAEVEDALKPPGRMASLVSQGARAGGVFTTPARDVDRIVERARAHLETLRASRLDAPALERQRLAFTGAYGAVVANMERVAAALERGDPSEVAKASTPFFASLRGLSSAISPSS